MEQEEDKEIIKIPDACLSGKKMMMEIYGDAHLKKYIMWKNELNTCWLDASMVLIAHNKVMKRSAQLSPKSKISEIIGSYAEAMADYNNLAVRPDYTKKLARIKLSRIQDIIFQHLQPKLKYKLGDPESAFCSLYNLLIEDSVIKGIFDATWILAKGCTNCGYNSESTKTKPIITLSKIDSFDPENLAVTYNCTCNKSEQKIRLLYVKLPQCLIFHFESGAGDKKPPLSFIIHEREYQLTSIMTLEKSQESNVNHFITWVRDPSVDKWLDCNDLNTSETTFAPDFPDIKFEDVYLCVYESFDDLGTIQVHKELNVKKSEKNIPCIDILEESEPENSNSLSNTFRSNLDTKILKVESNFKTCNINEQNTNLFSSEIQTGENKDSTILKKMLENAITINKQNEKGEEQNFSSSATNLEKYVQNKVLLIRLPAKTPKNSNLKDDESMESKALDSGKFENLVFNENIEQKNQKTPKKSEQHPLNSDATEKNSYVQLAPNSCFQQQEKSDAFLLEAATANKETKKEIVKPNVSSSVTNVAKYIQNKALLPTENLKTSDKESTEFTNLDCSKSGNSVSNDNIAEENLKNQNKPEQLSFNSNAEQKTNNDEFTSNSNSKQWEKSEAFLSEVASNNSGTSYVKLSLRRKKYPNPIVHKRYCLKNDSDQDSDEFKATDGRNCSKSAKGSKVLKQKIDEDSDKISQILTEQKRLVNEKEEIDYSKPEVSKRESKKPSRDFSKFKNPIGKKKATDYKNQISYFNPEEEECTEHLQDFSNQLPSNSGMVSGAENSNIIEGNEGKILKEFENEWSSHKPGCNCKSASVEETVDTVVDYVFAYFCKLGEEMKKKKSNSH